MIGVVAGQEVVSWVYLLNDDGTLATEFGYGYAGPAVNDGLTLSVDIIGGQGIRVLLPANKIYPKLKRGLVPIGFEADLVANGGAGGDAFLSIAIISSSGVLINVGSVLLNEADINAIEVQPDGEVTSTERIEWADSGGQTAIGPSDFFAPFLNIDELGAVTGHFESKLIVSAAQMTATYSAGTVDIYGVEI